MLSRIRTWKNGVDLERESRDGTWRARAREVVPWWCGDGLHHKKEIPWRLKHNSYCATLNRLALATQLLARERFRSCGLAAIPEPQERERAQLVAVQSAKLARGYRVPLSVSGSRVSDRAIPTAWLLLRSIAKPCLNFSRAQSTRPACLFVAPTFVFVSPPLSIPLLRLESRDFLSLRLSLRVRVASAVPFLRHLCG